MSARCEDVTVAIPVYNEEDFIAQAIESVLDQAGMIIIADNASTDRTPEICQFYADRYEHVKYVRHPRNLGAMLSAIYLLDCADTPYFMLLGSHDYVGDNYCFELRNALCEKPDAVLSYGKTRHLDMDDRVIRVSEYDEPALCSACSFERVYKIVDGLDWFIIYGLHRTEQLKRCLWRTPILGPDRLTLMLMAQSGPFVFRSTAVYYGRRVRPPALDDAYMERIAGKDALPPYRHRCGTESFKIALKTKGPGVFAKMRFLWRVRCSLKNGYLHWTLSEMILAKIKATSKRMLARFR